MNRKLLFNISLIFILLFVVIVSAQTFGDAIVSGNIFNTGSWMKGSVQSAITGWYPVQEWEVETCSRDVSYSFNPTTQANSGALSSNALIVDTAVTLQAYKYQNLASSNNYEYEISWYLHPLLEELSYEIQIYSEDEEVWKSLEPPIQKTAKPSYGDSGYETWNSQENISLVRIIAEDTYLETKVVEK